MSLPVAAGSAIWGSGPTDVYVVGMSLSTLNGYIMHYNGSSWTIVGTYANQRIDAVWGSGPKDVFAAGMDHIKSGSYVHHYDGTSWQTQMLPTSQQPIGLWGTGSGPSQKVFLITFMPEVWQYNGSGWVKLNINLTLSTGFKAIWGSSASDIFVVGTGGTIVHYDGKTWVTMTSSTSNDLAAIWGAGPKEVFAVGSGPALNSGIHRYTLAPCSQPDAGPDAILPGGG